MKIYVALFAVLMCLESSSSLFYGANTGLPQTKTLSSAINKCSIANEQAKSDICKVLKTALKFDNEDYTVASRDMTVMEYTFQSIGAFYNNFLYCLNDQNATKTSSQTIRNIDNLLIQLETFIITGIESSFLKAAYSLGPIFGESTKNSLILITDQFSKHFKIVMRSLTEIRGDFANIAEDGEAISIETINATLNIGAFNDMILAFGDIELTSKQFSSLVSGFVALSATLESITNAVIDEKTSALDAIGQGDYIMDISVQSSKKIFATKSLALQNDVEEAFSEFQTIGAQLFSGDEEVYAVRTVAENFVIEIKTIFDESSNHFQSFFTERHLETSKQISELKRTVADCSDKVYNFITESVSQSSGNFVKCFNSISNVNAATALVDTLGTSSAFCISQQTNTSLIAQSLLTFISEDTVLNVKTQADRLCACSVKGDKKTEEKSKRCMKRRADDLERIKVEERDYITAERENVFNIVRASSETFTSCGASLIEKFENSFERFQSTIRSCLAF